MKTIYIAITLMIISSFSLIDSQKLYKKQLKSKRYTYSIVEQKAFIQNNKQHIALKFGDDNIKPEYYGECYDFIQATLKKQTNWPLKRQDEMSISVFVNNQGKIVCITIFSIEDITLEEEQEQLIKFFNEVSTWCKPFEPAISDDNNKIYGWQWATGALEFPEE